MSSRQSMMMMAMNCFCGMVYQQNMLSLVSNWDHCQKFSPSQISDSSRVGFEPTQNLTPGFVK